MALIKTSKPYEILIRLGPDGYQAAHVVDLERWTDDETGAVELEREAAAQPISVERAGALLGEASVGLLAQVDALRAAGQALEAELAASREAGAAALRRAEAAEAALERKPSTRRKSPA